MSASSDDIREILVPWFKSLSGLDRVVWGYQDEARVQAPYGAIRIFSGLDGKGRGPKERRYMSALNPGKAMEIVGNEEFVLTCFVIGASGTDLSPHDYLKRVGRRIHDPDRYLLLYRAQTSTVHVKTVQNSAKYTITIENVPVEYTSDSSATATEIRNGLKAAVNANAWISELTKEPIVAADGDEDDLLEISCLPGIEFEISLDSKLEMDSNIGAVGLEAVKTYGINDLTRPEDTKYRVRAQLDIQFRESVREFIVPARIDSVTGEILGEAI